MLAERLRILGGVHRTGNSRNLGFVRARRRDVQAAADADPYRETDK